MLHKERPEQSEESELKRVKHARLGVDESSASARHIVCRNYTTIYGLKRGDVLTAPRQENEILISCIANHSL
jgi:hypothetical protein